MGRLIRFAVLSSAFWSSGLLAQGIGEVSIDRPVGVAQQPLKITIRAKGETPACGLEVNFGDGTSRVVRGDSFPVIVEHIYQQDGVYAVAVTGRSMTRGLRSLSPCEGVGAVAIQVGSGAVGSAGSPQGSIVAPSRPSVDTSVPGGVQAGNTTNLSPAMGMSFEAINPTNAKKLGFPIANYAGQVIRSVEPGSSAAQAGIAPGDVLSFLNDQPISQQLINQLQGSLTQGKPVKATIFRTGQWYSVNLVAQRAGAVPADTAPQTATRRSNNPPNTAQSHSGANPTERRPASQQASSDEAYARYVNANKSGVGPDGLPPFGIWGAPIEQNPEIAKKIGFPMDKYTGLLIGEVWPGSIAGKAGLTTNDVVTHINDQPLNQQLLSDARKQLSQGREVKVTAFRSGQWISTTLSAQQATSSGSQSQRASQSSDDLVKNLNDLAKAFDDLGKAFGGASSRSTQQPPASTNQGSGSAAVGQSAGTPTGAVSPSSCRQGSYLEPREFTQPEILGRPRGERAQMCFYRTAGSRTEFLNFFSTGHFYHTSISGSGGFASAGAVYGTVRGTYGFQSGGVLATRIGYQGTGVSQTNRGAGTQRDMDVSGQSRRENEVTLQNCQKITYADEAKRVQYDRSSSHPNFLIVDGVRWERYSMECPAWRGWVSD